MLNPDNVKAGIIFDQAVASDLTHFSFLDLFSLTADVWFPYCSAIPPLFSRQKGLYSKEEPFQQLSGVLNNYSALLSNIQIMSGNDVETDVGCSCGRLQWWGAWTPQTIFIITMVPSNTAASTLLGVETKSRLESNPYKIMSIRNAGRLAGWKKVLGIAQLRLTPHLVVF